MLEHDGDDFILRKLVYAESKLLVNLLLRAQDVARLKLHLLQKRAQPLLVKRFNVVVDFFERDAALTEQPIKLAACGSSRFLVNSNFIFHDN